MFAPEIHAKKKAKKRRKRAEAQSAQMVVGSVVQMTVENAAPRTLPAPTPGQIYRGYGLEDLWVFDLFSHVKPIATPGFVTNFLGARIRTSSLWNAVRGLDGQVMQPPLPSDLFETVEWIGLLKAVASAETSFAMMELGAGWAPWLIAAAAACRHLGVQDIHLLGAEADPGRFELMRQHFVDNGLDPDAHDLICAAVGTTAGHARWPKIMDPANAGGGRPVRDDDGVNQADADYIPYAVNNYIDVEIRPLGNLLAGRPLWDLVHIDVQGWEGELVANNIEIISERVKWLVIGTHSRALDGVLIEKLFQAGWVIENEKPSLFIFDSAKRSLDLMTRVDGTQVWRNPRLVSEEDSRRRLAPAKPEAIATPSITTGKLMQDDRLQAAAAPSFADIPTEPLALSALHVAGARLFASREDALACLPVGGTFAEIGVAYGDFSVRVLDRLKPAQFDAYDIFQLHKIEVIWGRPSSETFQGKTHQHFYESRFAAEVASGRMRVFGGDSSANLEHKPDEFYDVIYVDGDHSLKGVARDASGRPKAQEERLSDLQRLYHERQGVTLRHRAGRKLALR